jgi:hypothetical protein
MKVNCTIPYDSLNTIVKSTCKKYSFKRSIYCNHFFDDKCYIDEEKARYMKEFRVKNRECFDEFKFLLNINCGKYAYENDVSKIKTKAYSFDVIVFVCTVYLIFHYIVKLVTKVNKNK